MNPTWTVLDCYVIFAQQVQPPTLLANGFWCGQKIFQGSMICPDDYGSSQKMLSILFQTKYHT